MTVHELILILEKMDQDALVNIRNGYDPEYGNQYTDDFDVVEEQVGWYKFDVPVYEVFIE